MINKKARVDRFLLFVGTLIIISLIILILVSLYPHSNYSFISTIEINNVSMDCHLITNGFGNYMGYMECNNEMTCGLYNKITTSKFPMSYRAM